MLYQLSYYRNKSGDRKNGADTGTRTRDLRITNALLYQLSHIGGLNNRGAKLIYSRQKQQGLNEKIQSLTNFNTYRTVI